MTKQLNWFVVFVYIRLWFTSRTAMNPPVNDLYMISRLQKFDDKGLKDAGQKMVSESWTCHSDPVLITFDHWSEDVACWHQHYRTCWHHYQVTSQIFQIPRSSFTQYRLDSLALISIENEAARSLTYTNFWTYLQTLWQSMRPDFRLRDGNEHICIFRLWISY